LIRDCKDGRVDFFKKALIGFGKIASRTLMQEVELSSLDLRYEDCRLKSSLAEKQLLVSILESGIRDPLQGVDVDGERILLDGFKRYRCAVKLNIGIVPYICLGDDQALGIIQLIRVSNARSLNIVEQARLIEDLKANHKMSTSEIADLLGKSRGWVSMRAGLIGQMSKCVKEKIFKGDFPVYSFMYTLRRFMRMNAVSKSDIDDFVKAVSGRHLSIRDIDILASGYFKGSRELGEQIRTGNLSWGLSRIKEEINSNGFSKQEQAALKALEIILRYMQRFCAMRHGAVSSAFAAQANLLSDGIIRQLEIFSKAVRSFHDRCGQV